MNKLLGSAVLLISMLLPGLVFGQAGELTKAVSELADKLAFAGKGQVLGVEGDTIYISLGQQDGILEGNKFEVVRLGNPSWEIRSWDIRRQSWGGRDREGAGKSLHREGHPQER